MQASVHFSWNTDFVRYMSGWSLAEEGNDCTECSPLVCSVEDVLWSPEITALGEQERHCAVTVNVPAPYGQSRGRNERAGQSLTPLHCLSQDLWGSLFLSKPCSISLHIFLK